MMTVARADGAATAAVATTRRLVSLRFGEAGPPTPLPGVDVSLRAEVKLSAAEEAGGLDTIALIEAAPTPRILMPADTPMPVVQAAPRTVQLYKSDGNSFMPVTPNPVPLP